MATGMDDAAQNFMAMAKQMPRLGRDEELELARRWRDERDRRAADALVRAHLRDVAFIAYRYRHYEVPVSDLVAEGNLGLLRALDKFDPDRGFRFSTYAAYWIRAYVVSFILRSWSLVRNSSGVVRAKLFFRLRRERSRALTLLGDDDAAVFEMVAERLGVTRDAVEKLARRLDARDVSIDDPGREDGTPLIDSLIGDSDSETCVADREVRRKLDAVLPAALGKLDPRERFIIESRVLAPESEMSLADIGRHFQVSRERARQLEERARLKLRNTIIEHYGDALGYEV